MKPYYKAVVIGRFNPVMHNGHIELVRKALEVAYTVYIIVGSANKFPDVKNPIPSSMRVRTISRTVEQLFKGDTHRIKIKEVSDTKYNDEMWKTNIRTAIDEKMIEKVAMVGFEKDQDSYWLHEFGWDHIPVEPVMAEGKIMSMTYIRDAWLRDGTIGYINSIPKESLKFLLDFTKTSEYNRLRDERLYWDQEINKFDQYPYKGAMHHVCADSVVLCNNHILLIERKFAPGKGAWALPGGHKNENETFRYAALRELEEEVGLKVPSKVIRGSIRGSHLFDDPNRTAVFCKPTVAQFIILSPDNDGKLPRLKAGDDAKKAFWVPLHIIKKNPAILFDDHSCIINHFVGI